jgi:hypothetical protein
MSDTMVLLSWLVGVPLGVLIMAVLFVAACSLSSVKEPRFPAALGLTAAGAAACGAASWLLVTQMGKLDTDPQVVIGPMRLSGGLLSVLAIWVLLTGLYIPFLAPGSEHAKKPGVGKGLQVAGIQVLLGLLLAALVGAVVLVVLAVMQVTGKPPAAA